MKFINSTALTFLVSMAATTVGWGHSAMFPDSFKFDDSNEGDSAAIYATTSDISVAATTVCSGGSAGGYPCSNIDLRAYMPKSSLGGGSQNLNDIWGWTDPVTGKEIAIVGRTHGTAFVDISDPESPTFLGFLPTADGTSSWRDIKVYNDHAFIVADGGANNSHGMQVYDLTELRSVSPGSTLYETAHMSGFGNAHNIVINEDTGYAYAVGSNQCSGGLYMIDISNPTSPQYAGCFSADGYTHDAQCVLYNGPDSRYTGREICVGYNEDTLTVVDVTNKSSPVQVSKTSYSTSRYTHQGWFLDDNHSIVIMNDELDESNGTVGNTTSYIFDFSDLRNPSEIGRYTGPTSAIDHNLYANDGYVFEANYRAGLRILSTDSISSGSMQEVAYFDTIPGSNSAQFSGTWSSYVYFESGNIVVSDIGNGLFVVAPDWEAIENGDGGGGTDPEPAYCEAEGNSVYYEWIGSVAFGSYVNNSGAATYSDFTSEVITMQSGTSTSFTLTPEFRSTTYNEYWGVWIDLNGDYTFQSSEQVFVSNGSSSSSVSGSISIPSSASGTTTRMRVIMDYSSSPTACGVFSYGEVEDYTVNIL